MQRERGAIDGDRDLGTLMLSLEPSRYPGFADPCGYEKTLVASFYAANAGADTV